MNGVLAVIALRGLALATLLAGKAKLADTLYATADLVDAGRATDEHLRLVAEKLKARELEESDWEDVYARIEASRAQLHASEGGFAKPLLLALVAVLGLGVAMAAAPVRQATLSWSAVTQDVEGNAINGVTYNVYRGARAAAKAQVATGITGLSFVDTGRPAGVEDCYYVTAVKGGESAPSAEGCKSYPALAPASPTGLTVQ